MAVKKSEVIELKKVIGSDVLIIGKDRTVRELKKGRIAKVFWSSNCPDKVKETLKYYCKIDNIPYEELKDTDTDVGILCKKQFCISVAGVLKQK